VTRGRCAATSLGATVPMLLKAATTISGTVIGVFSRGCYLRFVESLLAVGDIPAGPLHVCCPLDLRSVTLGEDVALSATLLTIGEVSIHLAEAPLWDPALPNAAHLATARTYLAKLPDGCPDDLVSIWPNVVAAAANDRLTDAARLLGGRGGGSTPTGDDVLAGLLLADALWCGAERAHRLRLAVARSVRTTDLSQHFLCWAAHGQSIAPVHDVLDHAAAGLFDAVDEAATRVRAIGSSSGSAILAGIGLGARSRTDRLTKPVQT
jgi:hypothetical protein